MRRFRRMTFERMSFALPAFVAALPALAALTLAAGALSATSARAQINFLGITLGSSEAKAETKAPATTAKAEGCLGRPSGPSPRGSWWFYRLERGTGRRCWYLGPESRRSRVEATERRTTKAPARSLATSKRRTADTSQPESPAPTTSPSRAPSDTERTIAALKAWGAAAIAADPNRLQPAAPTAPAETARDEAVTQFALASHSNGGEISLIAAAETPAATPTPPATVRVMTDRASEPPPSVGQLLAFLITLVAFLAIAFRTVAKLCSAWLDRRGRNVQLRPSYAPMRPPVPVAQAFESPLQAPRETPRETEAPPPRMATVRRSPAARAPYRPADSEPPKERPLDYAPRHIRERADETAAVDRVRVESVRAETARDRLPEHDFATELKRNHATESALDIVEPRRRRRGRAAVA